MALSIAKWKAEKQAAYEFAVEEIRHEGDVKKLKADQIETLVKACKPPMLVFFDAFYGHFLGDDAKAAAQVLDMALDTPVEGQPHLEVDRRQWGDILKQLNAAGYQVSHTDDE